MIIFSTFSVLGNKDNLNKKRKLFEMIYKIPINLFLNKISQTKQMKFN
jgi:hypothetical protein